LLERSRDDLSKITTNQITTNLTTNQTPVIVAMSRLMRLEFPNADRQQSLNVLNHVCQRYNWVVYASLVIVTVCQNQKCSH
jgi:hypothetical protein